MTIPFIEENDQTQARHANLARLQELVGNPYPNKFERSRITGAEDTITNIVNFEEVKKHVPVLNEGEQPSPEAKDAANAELNKFRVRVSGRLATPPRVMGKAAFVHLSDGVERLQIYVRKQDARGISNDSYQPVEEENSGWNLFLLLDHGDFIGVEGYLFVTKTGEISIHVETLQFLSKALLPMPDKMHGIEDAETKQRRRYMDLIASSLKVEREPGELTTREVFERRARLISGMRRYLDDHGYTEVETPMLTPKATGAAAKPFVTHHNALDITLYARIAPELYLKRLLVGGFEKVYELNRNFRNEGISTRHNPEFTMLEFYCAYMDVNGMMDFAEEMIQEAVEKATGSFTITFGANEIDFSTFDRLTMKKAIVKNLDERFSILGNDAFDESWFDDIFKLRSITKLLTQHYGDEVTGNPWDKEKIDRNWKIISEMVGKGEFAYNLPEDVEKGRLITSLFELVAEEKLIQPTFIIDYPKSISPLSKASPDSPQIAERFELFINGMECANGFSELNDPEEQYQRFLDQMRERERGDEEAMVLDEDYIRALSYGMPPAAGIGIGIDRLAMLLTNRHSIRDVILFPHMRPERKAETEEEN